MTDPCFQLLAVSGDGTRVVIEPGHVAYVWSEDPMSNRGARVGAVRAAVEDARDELTMIRPDGVCVHGSPSQLLARGADGSTAIEWAARELRAILPGVRLWVGVGCDGWVDEWRAGHANEASVQQPLQRVAAMAAALSAEAIVWNAESAWKHHPSDARSREALEGLARGLMAKLTQVALKCVHVVSSFDHVGFHRAMPFDALLSGNVAAFTAQNYVARAGAAPKGALFARMLSAVKSQRAARAEAWFPADEVKADGADASHDDVDVFATVQLHGTDPTDLTRVLAETPLVLSWSVPMVREGGRMDEQGMEAAIAAMVIRRAVGTGPGAVRLYQQRSGSLVVDGIPGPNTRAYAKEHASP